MAKLFGRATITVGGKLLDSMKGATIDFGGIARTSKVTAKHVAGFTEEVKASRIECSIPVAAGTKASDFDLVDVPILFKADTGQNFTVPKAWRTETPTTGDQDGELKLVFEGEAVEEN